MILVPLICAAASCGDIVLRTAGLIEPESGDLALQFCKQKLK